MKLIVNADDMGYTESISNGIVYGYKNGIISSTTVMCHMPYATKVPKLIEGLDDLGVGVHLTLTCGRPLTNGKSFVDENGDFLKYKIFYNSYINPQEAYTEFKAQIERFIQIFNRKPTHIDSHQGCHDGVTVLLKAHPEMAKNHNTKEIYDVAMQLAEEYDLPVRRSCNYKWTDAYYGDNATVETFIKTLQENKDTDMEFMVHPGYCDLELYNKSSYNTNRVKELAGLCDPALKDYIDKNNIELVHF